MKTCFNCPAKRKCDLLEQKKGFEALIRQQYGSYVEITVTECTIKNYVCQRKLTEVLKEE